MFYKNLGWERCDASPAKIQEKSPRQLSREDATVKNEIFRKMESKNILPMPIEDSTNPYSHDGMVKLLKI